MLRTLLSKKSYFIVPLLALLYFVIGAHALHPAFHKHKEISPHSGCVHSHCQVYHHPHIKDNVDNSEHSACPICNFFVSNSASDARVFRLFVPTFSERHIEHGHRIINFSEHPSGYQIRGPPS